MHALKVGGFRGGVTSEASTLAVEAPQRGVLVGALIRAHVRCHGIWGADADVEGRGGESLGSWTPS